MPNLEPWYVVGAGSLGQLWAALLHRAARPVCLVLRTQERLDEYRRAGGITLHEEYGWGRLTPPAVATAGAMRRILVATKAHQTMAALEPYAALRDNSLSIAILQNGMGAAEEVQARFPSAWVYYLVTMTSAWREGPFDVHRAGRGKTFVGRHGAPDAGEQDASMIARSLTVPGLEVEFSADIRVAQWRKLVVNCVINPLSAILEIRNGQVPTDPRALKVMGALCQELATVASAEGVPLGAGDVLALVESACRITADNYNSMLQDVRAGRPTEIDYINGYMLGRAREHGIDCPANQALYDDVRSRTPRR